MPYNSYPYVTELFWKVNLSKRYLAWLPGQIEIATTWDGNIASIWRSIDSVESSCVVTGTTNPTWHCSAQEINERMVSVNQQSKDLACIESQVLQKLEDNFTCTLTNPKN